MDTMEVEAWIKSGKDVDERNIELRSCAVILDEILDYVSEGNYVKRVEARKQINLPSSTKNHVFSGREPTRDVALIILVDLAYFYNKNKPDEQMIPMHQIQDWLQYLGQSRLYVKKRRDYIVYRGICQRMNSDEINEDIIAYNAEHMKKLKELPVESY